jgi:hypothetical protein
VDLPRLRARGALVTAKLEQVRTELLQLEADREKLHAVGLKTPVLDRRIEAKRRTYALLTELAQDLAGAPAAARGGM